MKNHTVESIEGLSDCIQTTNHYFQSRTRHNIYKQLTLPLSTRTRTRFCFCSWMCRFQNAVLTYRESESFSGRFNQQGLHSNEKGELASWINNRWVDRSRLLTFSFVIKPLLWWQWHISLHNTCSAWSKSKDKNPFSSVAELRPMKQVPVLWSIV